MAGAVAALALTGCGSSSTRPHTAPGVPNGSSTTRNGAPQGRTALDRWKKAYAYLRTRTGPTEIVCAWFSASGDTAFVPVRRPTTFYNFSDSATWTKHIVTRNDPPPKRAFEDCVATVPTTVRYGPAIETFLGSHGLTFAADHNAGSGLRPIEIAYAGQNAEDPDRIYRDKPGLFGLRLALTPLGKDVFEPGTAKIVQPTGEATAALYLRYATPLLDWYRHKR